MVVRDDLVVSGTPDAAAFNDYGRVRLESRDRVRPVAVFVGAPGLRRGYGFYVSLSGAPLHSLAARGSERAPPPAAPDPAGGNARPRVLAVRVGAGRPAADIIGIAYDGTCP